MAAANREAGAGLSDLSSVTYSMFLEFSQHLRGLESFTRGDGLNLHSHLSHWWPLITEIFHELFLTVFSTTPRSHPYVSHPVWCSCKNVHSANAVTPPKPLASPLCSSCVSPLLPSRQQSPESQGMEVKTWGQLCVDWEVLPPSPLSSQILASAEAVVPDTLHIRDGPYLLQPHEEPSP